LAGAVAAVLVVAVLLAVKRAGGVALISSLFRVGLIALVVLGVWLFVQQQQQGVSAQGTPVAERRSLDDRKTALMAGSIAPGSALSCLDELAGDAVEAACEKAVFASPEAVAAGVKYVTAQLALLNDGSVYAERGDASYAAELTPLRTALELDRFGLVAHVLGDQGCTPDRCDALMRLRDSSKVLANLRDHTFDEQVKKYTAIWNAPKAAEGLVAAAGPPVALPGAQPPGTVAPRYDFPSSKSIPPVSIMAPEATPPREPPPPREPAPEQSAAVGPAGATPVPPRRPPQVRAAPPPRPAAVPRPEPADPDAALTTRPPGPLAPPFVR
jgi:hypothetical protein